MHISQNEPHLPKDSTMLAAIMKELGTGDGASTATRCRMALIEAIKTGVLLKLIFVLLFQYRAPLCVKR